MDHRKKIKPATRKYIRSLRGSLKNKKVWEAFLDDRRRGRKTRNSGKQA